MLEGKKIVVFDLEIKNPIENCSKGWDSLDEMGISVMVLYDYRTMRYRVFDDKNVEEGLKILKEADLVSGFNIHKFDWPLLVATNPDKMMEIEKPKEYDVLREIWKALKLNPDHFVPSTHGGYKLDTVAGDTMNLHKSGNGALAPIMYQEGRIAELHDYCIQDVKVEKELFEFVVRYGYIVCNGRRIILPNPLDLL